MIYIIIYSLAQEWFVEFTSLTIFAQYLHCNQILDLSISGVFHFDLWFLTLWRHCCSVWVQGTANYSQKELKYWRLQCCCKQEILNWCWVHWLLEHKNCQAKAGRLVSLYFVLGLLSWHCHWQSLSCSRCSQDYQLGPFQCLALVEMQGTPSLLEVCSQNWSWWLDGMEPLDWELYQGMLSHSGMMLLSLEIGRCHQESGRWKAVSSHLWKCEQWVQRWGLRDGWRHEPKPAAHQHLYARAHGQSHSGEQIKLTSLINGFR